MLQKFRIVLDLEVEQGGENLPPDSWDWHGLLDLMPHEFVAVVGATVTAEADAVPQEVG